MPLLDHDIAMRERYRRNPDLKELQYGRALDYLMSGSEPEVSIAHRILRRMGYTDQEIDDLRQQPQTVAEAP